MNVLQFNKRFKVLKTVEIQLFLITEIEIQPLIDRLAGLTSHTLLYDAEVEPSVISQEGMGADPLGTKLILLF